MQIGSKSFSAGPRSTALDDIVKGVEDGSVKSTKFIKASVPTKIYSSGFGGAIDNFLAKHGNVKAQKRQQVAREYGAIMVVRLIDQKFGKGIGEKVLGALSFSPNAEHQGFRRADFSKGIMAGELKMLMESAQRIADGGSYRRPEREGPTFFKQPQMINIPALNIETRQDGPSQPIGNGQKINIPDLQLETAGKSTGTVSGSEIDIDAFLETYANSGVVVDQEETLPPEEEKTYQDNLEMILNFVSDKGKVPEQQPDVRAEVEIEDLGALIDQTEVMLKETPSELKMTARDFETIIFGNEKDDVGEDLLGDLLSEISNSEPKSSMPSLSETSTDIEVTESEIDDLVADLMNDTDKDDVALGNKAKKEYVDLYEPEPFEDEPRNVIANGLTKSEIFTLADLLDEIHNNKG